MKAQVMKRAWELAKQGVMDFGGKVKEYFQQALVIAWAETKEVVKVSVSTMEEVAAYLNEKGLFVYETKANIWEKHGFRRIYVTVDGVKAYLQFNVNNQITKTFVESNYEYKIIDEVKSFAKLYNEGRIYA